MNFLRFLTFFYGDWRLAAGFWLLIACRCIKIIGMNGTLSNLGAKQEIGSRSAWARDQQEGLPSMMGNQFMGARVLYGEDGSEDAFDVFFSLEDEGLSAVFFSSFFLGAAALLGLDLFA